MADGNWTLLHKFTDTSPAAAGAAASTDTLTGVSKYSYLLFVAIVTGGTGGTTDITVESEIVPDVWVNWARTPAVAATVTTKYSIVPEATTIVTTTGTSTAAVPSIALAAGICIGGHPGDKLRLVYTAGAGTSAGAAQTVYVLGRQG